MAKRGALAAGGGAGVSRARVRELRGCRAAAPEAPPGRGGEEGGAARRRRRRRRRPDAQEGGGGGGGAGRQEALGGPGGRRRRWRHGPLAAPGLRVGEGRPPQGSSRGA
ncbi:Hypothetical predicted protein [Podarcis lilfordi]|uniref:Uncharacterized protein n=1 Tax=Podarcis lilfordi TaxID=74358 RepID=A0AA35L0J0_9SAUR|nr:Hypothetical predicted protein [Podarcis lilfordi]